MNSILALQVYKKMEINVFLTAMQEVHFQLF